MMLVPLINLLPLLAASAVVAVPVAEHIAADIEPRQQRGSGGRGNNAGGGRPSGNWRNAQGGATINAAPAPATSAAAPTSAMPAASSAAAPAGANSGATGGAGTADGAAATGSTGSTGSADSGGSTGDSSDSITGDSGSSGDTGSDTTSNTDTGSTGNTGSDSNTSSDSSTGDTGSSGGSNTAGGVGGSGPIGTGWDPAENTADLSTYAAAGLQWWYDWLVKPSIDTAGVEYVPMVKGKGEAAELANAMASWPSGTQYVLSFNEPDTASDVGGTAMSAHAEAAELHNQVVETLGGNYKISTPGVTRGGEVWMDQWIAECEKIGGCHYDFTAYHYYGTDVQDLIAEVKMMHERYGKEVWLTEWACYEFNPKYTCTPEETEAFMTAAIEWFRGEGASIVTRWAWFGAFQDMTNWHNMGYNMDMVRIANPDGTINALGEKYIGM